MNDEHIHERLLEEMKKITTFIEFQKKLSKWMLIGGGVLLALGLVVTLFFESRIEQHLDESVSPEQEEWGWYDVDYALRRTRVDEALTIAETLLQKVPTYYQGHLKIAEIYVIQEELEQAEAHFMRAYELFPSEENKHHLQAIQMRRKASHDTPPH